ncbi:MAG: hypothetical protein JWQ38_208 [Flavipsychrobacter sp.]|nr:hypothetical protein [Flavipsychrobacter sp.]
MRNVLLLLLLLLPVAAFCKDKKHKQLKLPVSRWQEVKRMGLDSSIIPFQDTLFVTFLKKDSFIYHNLNGFVYRGGYTINEDSLLDFGTARYKIATKRPNMLTLVDDKGMYVLAPDLSDTVKIIVLDTNDKPLPVTNIDQMIGHWTVYKREAKEVGAIDAATSITAAYITGPSTDGKLGYVYGGQDAKNNPSWYIKSFGIDQVLECDGKNLRVLKVIKCQKGEMILEESDIKYYFKQFK